MITKTYTKRFAYLITNNTAGVGPDGYEPWSSINLLSRAESPGKTTLERRCLVRFTADPTVDPDVQYHGYVSSSIEIKGEMRSGDRANKLVCQYTGRQVGPSNNTWNKQYPWLSSDSFESKAVSYSSLKTNPTIHIPESGTIGTDFTRQAVAHGVCISLSAGSDSSRGYLSLSEPVKIVVNYTDQELTFKPFFTTNFLVPYRNPHKEGYFYFYISAVENYTPVSVKKPTSTVFHWRKQGDQAYNDIAVQGDLNYVYVPANTFPAGVTIESYLTSTFEDGTTNDSTTYSFTTKDSSASARYVSPNQSIQDETKEIVLKWSSSAPSYSGVINGFDVEFRAENEEWSEPIHVSGETRQYSVPANTFGVSKIYWRVRAYNADDVPGGWSETYFTTIDTPSIAEALAPNATINDGTIPILFTWKTSNKSGTASTGADLQYSIDNITWNGLGPAAVSGPQIPGNVHEYELPGNTLLPGVIFWRVRSYNRNISPGDWSAALSFVNRAAPRVLDLETTTKPWAVVNWQSDDQLTYEVFVDGESLGSFFGGERQYQLPDYLSDGDHTVGVRVLGSFSLWSQILETQVHIENSPALQLVLKAMTDIDTELVWTGGVGDFYIYRDGLMIGHTNEHSFTDRTAVGVHDYLVVERLASGDYNASAVLTRTPSVDCQHIAALAGGEWIAIPHTLKSQSDPAYSESQEVEYNYLAGSDYPTASVGSQRNDSGSYSAVFLYTEQDEHKRFLALRGKPVIFKTADGEVMIGILHAWERKPKLSRNKQYYTAYTFNIQRVGWGDFIDDTV